MKNCLRHTKNSLLAFIFFATTNAFACSCKSTQVDEIVYTHGLGLSKIQVAEFDWIKKVRSLFNSKQEFIRTYKVKVLENYKGSIDTDYITIYGHGEDGDCGFDVGYGDVLYVITPINNWIIPNEVSVCNRVSQRFAEELKAELKSPSNLYDSVDTSDWTLVNKASNHSLYADTKNVTKDEYGSYIWLLLNGGMSDFKSHKSKIQIACKEKMFSVSHEIGFSEYNAKGNVLMTKKKGYKWMPLTSEYSKLLKYMC